MYKIFGKILKYLREKQGLTQKELAEDLHMQRTKIGRLENANTEPTLKDLTNIADYFNVSTDYLLGRENENKTENKHFNHKENLKQKAI